MTAVPNDVSLVVVNPSAQIISSDHRTNYAAIQAAINALIACLAGGAAGQVVVSIDGTDVQWAAPKINGITGQLSSVGAVVQGTGFTSAHTSTGTYTVTFGTALSASPIVVATPVTGGGQLFAEVTAVATTGVEIVVADIAGTAVDNAVYFVALVPQ